MLSRAHFVRIGSATVERIRVRFRIGRLTVARASSSPSRRAGDGTSSGFIAVD
jgi:hypothetical protein